MVGQVCCIKKEAPHGGTRRGFVKPDRRQMWTFAANFKDMEDLLFAFPRKGSDTKERILDLAEAAVLEKGFAGTVIGVATGWLS